VAYSVDTITFTPTAAHDKATITVKGESVASGQPSVPISLSVGDNSIPIIVTAEDSTTKTYTVIVNRNSPPSNNANLSKLDIKYIGGVVSERNIEDPIYPIFDSTIISYILHLVGTEDDIEIVPTVEDPSANAIVLYNAGLCVYFIHVTAEDGITQNNYAIQAYFYDSIKAALEGNSNLISEHIVTVVPGTYQEGDTINFPDKAIRLQSIDPGDDTVRDATIIDGAGTYRVFSFNTLYNLGSGTNLTGFTIQNGYTSDGGGIYINNTSPSIIDNTILGNICTNLGGGIYITGTNSNLTTIVNNTISENISNRGGGIYINNSSPIITSNEISGNGCTNRGGGIYIAGTTSSPIIGGSDDSDKNTICGNDVNGISTKDNQVYPNNYDSIHINNYICASCDDCQ
jgi:hypothetical protein